MQTFDIDECAAFLKVHPNTVLELAAKGDLPGAKIGRAWVFLQEDVMDYLRAQVRQQVQERKGNARLDQVAARQQPMIVASARPAGRRRNPIPTLPDFLPERVGQV